MTNFIVRRYAEQCSNATSQDVVLDPWPENKLVRWTHVAGRDLAHAPTRIETMLLRGTRYYYLAAGVPAAAGHTVGGLVNVVAPGDFRVCARFVGATSGDLLELFAFGEVLG